MPYRSTTHILLILILCFILVGCHKKETPTYKIGVSQCSEDQWRDKMNEEMRREMLFHDDAYLEILSQKDDNEKQIADIQSFIDRDFDIIIVAPNEAEAFTPIIKKAYDSGIPVIIFDRRINGNSFTSYIDLDNRGIGYAAAEYARSLMGDQQANVVEITGLPGSSPAQERHRGFIDGLDSFTNVKLLASVPGYWERENAYSVMDSLLKQFPEINVVYAHNDFMALGVDSLLRERGRRDIKILGTDASPGQGIPAIKDGKIDASFIYPTEGHRIIRTAFAILQGDSYDTVVHIPALTSVDISNAEILLRQDELLKDETNKVLLLDDINDKLAARHTSLTRFLNAVVTLAIILAVVLAVTLFMFFRNHKLQKELKKQNKFLEDLLLEKSSNITRLPANIEETGESEPVSSDTEEKTDISDSDSKENEFYKDFLNIIKTSYTDPTINMEKMAQKMNLGPAQFSRKIKAITHNSPVEILRNFRLEQARKLLLTTNKSINEITFEVGFTSPAYLTKCFREHFSITPTELRNRN